jgi:DNA (cytosine-5)-methyltransferase 1
VTRTLESVPSYSDYFCGFGGSSQGARKLGLNIRMAANHWDLAVETHALNFPDSDHDQADISGTDPRRHPTTTIAWFSPECTNHSMAKGKKRQAKATQMAFGEEAPPLPDAAAERSRATMWDVPRFAEYHRYRYVIVENVVDARYWIMWDAWLQAMAAMEYEHHVVYLNSMHAGSDVAAPAPQSRDRMYVVFWQRGERPPDLDITPPAWCGHCDRQVEARQSWKKPLHRWGRYRAQYVYRCPSCLTIVEPYTLPAAVAIDWTVPGQRIGDRPKPLAPKTIARIEAGIRRYGRPLHLEAAGNTYDAADPKHPQHGQPGAYMRAWPADTEPLRTLHNTASKALLVPVEGRDGKDARSTAEVMRTMTTRDETGLAFPPFITVHRSRADDDHRTRSIDGPLPTITASGHFLGTVVPPFIAELRGGGSKHRPTSVPLATLTASGTHHGLVQPPDVEALVMRNNSSRGDGAEMSTPVHEPLRTLTTTGHQSLITWQALYGYDGGALRPLGQPMPTQTTVQGDGLLTGTGLPDVDDCLFRMLEPAEIGAGMAFERDYQVLGNKREQVRGYGNAVTPCAGSLLLSRVVAALTGEAAA